MSFPGYLLETGGTTRVAAYFKDGVDGWSEMATRVAWLINSWLMQPMD